MGRIASLYEKDRKAKRFYSSLTHAGTYDIHPAVDLVCGADIDRRKLTKFRNRWGVKRVYANYREMLDENELDILSICTHSEEHYEIIRAAAKRVKVIFCEKPFTKGSTEIKKIIAMKNRSGTKIAINLYREYDKSHRGIRRVLQQERYGKIQRVNCYYGKGLRNMGSHLLGYLLGTLGVPSTIEVLNKRGEPGGEHSYDVYLEFTSGVPVMIQACDFRHYRLFEMDFLCERGRIQILDEGLVIKRYETGENRAESGASELQEKRKEIKSTVGYALYYAIDHLVKLARNPYIEPAVSPERYLELQCVIEEIEKQGGNIRCVRN